MLGPCVTVLGLCVTVLGPRAGRAEVTFVFGDLHLADIRRWREDHLGSLGPQCLFPVFGKSYTELAQRLGSSPYNVSLCRKSGFAGYPVTARIGWVPGYLL